MAEADTVATAAESAAVDRQGEATSLAESSEGEPSEERQPSGSELPAAPDLISQLTTLNRESGKIDDLLTKQKRALQQKKRMIAQLQEQLSSGAIQLDEAQRITSSIKEELGEQQRLSEELQAKLGELGDEQELYFARNRAKWVAPVVVGLAAAYTHADDRPALWGFASFGAVMGWEQTGYGPGRALGSAYIYAKDMVTW